MLDRRKILSWNIPTRTFQLQRIFDANHGTQGEYSVEETVETAGLVKKQIQCIIFARICNAITTKHIIPCC